MAVKYFNRDTSREYCDRLDQLTPDAQRQWGKLDCTKMLCHLRLTLSMSLGEVDVEQIDSLMIKYLGRFIAYHTPLPWPKGKIKVPDKYTPEAEFDFAGELAGLKEKMHQFIEALDTEPNKQTIHPGFGPVSIKYWSRIHGKHMDHHLKQFGV